MKNIEAIVKPFKLDTLKDRLRQVGAQGLTVSEVRGFGRGGREKDSHPGSRRAVDFNPKVRIQMVSDDEHGAAHRRGDPGYCTHRRDRGWKDSSSVEVVDVIRIRTGERGHDAL